MRYIALLTLVLHFSCDTTDKQKLYTEAFNDLSETEKAILHSDTLNGNFLKYEGEIQGSMKIEFLLDSPNRFAIKRTVNRGDFDSQTEIACSGRWSLVMEDAMVLRFYFVPKDFSNILDSTVNKGKAQMLLPDMAGLHPTLDTLWIYGIPCIKAKTDR